MLDPTTWTDLDLPGSDQSLIGFCRGYSFPGEVDLREIAVKLPEGAVLVSPELIAGTDHVRAILTQALESWSRKMQLARNRSIDLLMRITCRYQIAAAIESSGIQQSVCVVLFGLVRTVEQIEHAEGLLTARGAVRNDSVISLKKQKILTLRKLHRINRSVKNSEIALFLAEESSLLSFGG